MRLYVDNQEVVTAPNVGIYKTINLDKKMYLGTVYTDDKTLPDRYVIQLFMLLLLLLLKFCMFPIGLFNIQSQL